MNFPFSFINSKAIQIKDQDTCLTYENLLQLARALYSLRSEKPPQLASLPSICIYIDRSPYYIALILSAWMAGFSVIPLNTSWNPEKCYSIIKSTKPSLTIVDHDLLENMLEYPRKRLIDLLSEISALGNQYSSLPGLKKTDICYTIFTSGSTGAPKGVIISTDSYSSYVHWTSRYFASYSHLKTLVMTSEFTFDIAMGDLAFALSFGTDIVTLNNVQNIPLLMSLIHKFHIDVLYSVPTTHLALVSFAKLKKNASLQSIKLILSGGDKFPLRLVKDYIILAPSSSFFNVYGPTECTINCFAIRLDNILNDLDINDSPPIGFCFDSLDFFLLDGSGSFLNSEQGELCISGDQLMVGYHSDEAKTSAAFIPDPRTPFCRRLYYKTGDIAFIKDGLLYLRGRKDNLVKIKGYRIHPDEVSQMLDQLDFIDVSVCVAVENLGEYKLHAFITTASKKSDHQDIVLSAMQYLRDKLPPHLVPSSLRILSTFPLNQSGKIDKNQLINELSNDY
jgi:D-alanine--poly(phosphoribitol) ligase subunit 1